MVWHSLVAVMFKQSPGPDFCTSSKSCSTRFFTVAARSDSWGAGSSLPAMLVVARSALPPLVPPTILPAAPSALEYYQQKAICRTTRTVPPLVTRVSIGCSKTANSGLLSPEHPERSMFSSPRHSDDHTLKSSRTASCVLVTFVSSIEKVV